MSFSIGELDPYDTQGQDLQSVELRVEIGLRNWFAKMERENTIAIESSPGDTKDNSKNSRGFAVSDAAINSPTPQPGSSEDARGKARGERRGAVRGRQ
ncbi:hypothetical protein MMC22_009315 [Lobaria immixta]|nr:hypothetical protein [Lobaria immixta]